MKKQGIVRIKKEIQHTMIWPAGKLEALYKDALIDKIVDVMDISVDGSGYLVLGESKDAGHFLWMVEKSDTVENSYHEIKSLEDTFFDWIKHAMDNS